MGIFIHQYFWRLFEQAPLVLIDIGASGGIPPHWRQARQFLHVIGFEPDMREYERLAKTSPKNMHYLNTALYSGKTRLTLHLAREQKVSSIFQPDRPFLDQFPQADSYDIVGTAELDADSLDNQLGEHGFTDADFMKIDTQGAELAILQGASSALERMLFGVEVEVEFRPIYKDQPLFGDVDACMRSQGFELFALRPVTWKRKEGVDVGGPRGQLVFADALYFKTPSAFSDLLTALPDAAARQAKLLHAFAICSLYEQLDYMAHLYEQWKGVFAANEQKIIEQRLRRERRTRIGPDFRGRWRLSRWLYHMAEAVDPCLNSWSISGKLGNME